MKFPKDALWESLEKSEGLSLVEALRTGLPIRRPVARHRGSHGNGYISRDLILRQMTGSPVFNMEPIFPLTEQDILANDWEVGPAPTWKEKP